MEGARSPLVFMWRNATEHLLYPALGSSEMQPIDAPQRFFIYQRLGFSEIAPIGLSGRKLALKKPTSDEVGL